MSDFVCFVEYFLCFGGPECQILVIFGPWGRQVGMWASRGRLWGPKPGESLLLGYHFGTVLGHFRGMFSRCFFGRPLDHVFDDFGMVLGSISGSFSSPFGHKKGTCTK